MSKQGTRSKAKQRQASGKPGSGASNRPSNGSSSANGSAVKSAQPSTNGVDTSVKTGTATNAKTSVATKPATSTTKTSGGTGTKPSQPEVVNASLHRAGSKQQRRQQKMQSRVAAQKTVAKSTRLTIVLVAAAVIVAVGLVGYFVFQGRTASSTQTVVDPNFQPIDGIYCDASEQLAYHIHAQLTIYIDGQPVSVPQGVGIAPGTSPTCLYWMHTHDTSGVIHIESPTTKLYTLQNFLDIWQSFTAQSISYPTQLASANGWTIYVNGKVVKGDFKSISLNEHDLVTIMYNSPSAKPVTTYNWPAGE